MGSSGSSLRRLAKLSNATWARLGTVASKVTMREKSLLAAAAFEGTKYPSVKSDRAEQAGVDGSGKGKITEG